MKKKRVWYRILLLLSFLWVFSYVYLTMSKTAYILLLLVLLLSIPYYFKLPTVKTVLILVILVGSLVGSIYFDVIKLPRRIEQAKKELTEIDSEALLKKKYLGSSESRYMIWYTSLHLWKEYPILGTGVGDVYDDINKEYKEIEQSFLQRAKYGSHSQFLEVLLATGITGFLSMLWFLGVLLASFVIKRNYMGITLFLIFLVAGAVEKYWGGFSGGIFSGLMLGLVALGWKSDSTN